MAKPRLLDLFCGGGGCTRGYQQAGFYVVGVDVSPQPGYCGDEFHQADATAFPLDGFDVISASPPCQDHSAIRTVTKADHGTGWMVEATYQRLRAHGQPWVIENVPGAPMVNPLMLCGSMFDMLGADDDGTPLYLRRHRLFDSSHLLMSPGPCRCAQMRSEGRRAAGVYGHGGPSKARGYKPNNATNKRLMGIDWMTRDRLSQAIPPAYTEWIGRQLLACV